MSLSLTSSTTAHYTMLCIYFNWRSLENSSKTSNVGHHDGYLTRNDKYLVEKQIKKYQVLVKSVLVVL